MNWYKKSQTNLEDPYPEEGKYEMGNIVKFPFQEGVPSPDKVKQMKEWLNSKKDIFMPSYIKMYHATDPSIPILEKGLKPTSNSRRRSYQSESGFVYLANTPERAKTFGDLGNSGRSIIYEIVVPINKLMPDLDQLNNIRASGQNVGNSLAESIIYGGGARLKGKIEPYAIRVYQGV